MKKSREFGQKKTGRNSFFSGGEYRAKRIIGKRGIPADISGKIEFELGGKIRYNDHKAVIYPIGRKYTAAALCACGRITAKRLKYRMTVRLAPAIRAAAANGCLSHEPHGVLWHTTRSMAAI